MDSLCHCPLVNLISMHTKPLGCVELSVAVHTFKVLVLLVLHERGLVYKLPITVPAPGLLVFLFFLLAPHPTTRLLYS